MHSSNHPRTLASSAQQENSEYKNGGRTTPTDPTYAIFTSRLLRLICESSFAHLKKEFGVDAKRNHIR